ncbi:hypothetical protein NVP1193O_076 [Vibrio phage 1.193.O._10N.286.52.C6]|nr:hypothetical protein NVP1193O_076 [Vibrio phage 1.193.O._10N.286.52.C6]
MVLLTKTQAERIYGTWCSSEDSKFEYKSEVFELEYDEDADVAYVDEDGDGDWVKLINLYQRDIEVSVAEWVYKTDNSWRE